MTKAFKKIGLISVLSFLIVSCSWKNPEAKMQQLATDYNKKKITNLTMLLEMGQIFLDEPQNINIRKDYFNRMIISGYASWVLHYYLTRPEMVKSEEDQKIILFALNSGNHYNLGRKFLNLLSDSYLDELNKIMTFADTLDSLNNLVAIEKSAQAFALRSSFFVERGEVEMSKIDLNRSFSFDPCSQEAIYQKAVMLFDEENTSDILKLFNRCNDVANDQKWMSVFINLAQEVEKVKGSDKTENEKLFELANLYVNNGFPVIALRKSEVLVMDNPQNANYLALHAFVYYNMGDKNKALKFIIEAEELSGQRSKLRTMIEQMN